MVIDLPVGIYYLVAIEKKIPSVCLMPPANELGVYIYIGRAENIIAHYRKWI